MTKISYRYVLTGALIGAVIALLSTCVSEPAYSKSRVDSWPIEVGDVIHVTTVCDKAGFDKMKIAFETDTSIDFINDLYNLLLVKGDCIALPGRMTAEGKVISVSEQMVMQTGETVYAIGLNFDAGAPTVYTFVIVRAPPDTDA